jgi:hypothetical protein
MLGGKELRKTKIKKNQKVRQTKYLRRMETKKQILYRKAEKKCK